MSIKPHPDLYYCQADVIAECWEDVPLDLYKVLCNTIVPLYDSEPKGEAPGECIYGIAEHTYWKHLSTEHKLKLNQLALDRKEI